MRERRKSFKDLFLCRDEAVTAKNAAEVELARNRIEMMQVRFFYLQLDAQVVDVSFRSVFINLPFLVVPSSLLAY